MKISVIGLGYIGLPTASLLATHGHEVIGIDIDSAVIEKINQGIPPVEETGLSELLNKAVATKKLVAKINVEESDTFIISVPTPLNTEHKTANLQFVESAAETIYPLLKKGNLVILESTVPPGTTEKFLLPILEKSGLSAGKDFHVSYCPERAIPGDTLHEMIHDDRVIGGIDDKSAEKAASLYSCFVQGSLFKTSARTAEFVKLMENTYRDINIALANEFAQIGEKNLVDIWEARDLANRHPRVNILKPGPGVGGHCISIDPWFLTNKIHRSQIISLAREINDSMPLFILELVKHIVSGIRQPVITVLGVAYKGGINDTRETPALKFIEAAKREGYMVQIHDPLITQFHYPLLSLEEACTNSDCIVVITDHADFMKINPKQVSTLVRHKNLVDTRNMLDHAQWKRYGFTIKVLGEGSTL